ncbi:alpha/beta hydrolase [Pseudonocardia acaciae]|uniref:alpha/beta hydrolase n=1 Tax=Pseudonocardia acaciae TaxID=551276 RepID=UPI00048AFF21|nr:alpha/beta fold hydrolase [Pseudonocardia acaciae]
MTNFVLVPGACHGGWWYQPVVDALRSLGHTARALTLAGLDGQRPAGQVNLDTHIEEVTAEVGDDVVLVGHSYGGSVITGVADRVPERVRALVYLDAFVPEDGDSCYAMIDDELRRWYIEGSGRTGYGLEPMPFFDPRAVPHPTASLFQRIRLTGAWRKVPVKHYAAATWPGRSPLADTIERVRADPSFVVHDWPTPHNVLHDGPGRVLDLLDLTAGR